MKWVHYNKYLIKEINENTSYYLDYFDRAFYLFYDEHEKRIIYDNKLEDHKLVSEETFLSLIEKDYPLDKVIEKVPKVETTDFSTGNTYIKKPYGCNMSKFLTEPDRIENYYKKITEKIIKENKMNYCTKENYKECIIKVFAPGAAKNNTDIKIDHSTRELLIECKPNINFEDIDLYTKESLTINERYNLKEKIKANIATGIITIKIPVDSNIITSVEIGD